MKGSQNLLAALLLCGVIVLVQHTRGAEAVNSNAVRRSLGAALRVRAQTQAVPQPEAEEKVEGGGNKVEGGGDKVEGGGDKVEGTQPAPPTQSTPDKTEDKVDQSGNTTAGNSTAGNGTKVEENNNTTKPDNTTKPADNTTKPENNTTKPENNTTKPETNTTKPETNTTKPETNTTKPEDNTTKPETNTTKPETNTTKPENNTTKPETNTTKPETNTTKPADNSTTTTNGNNTNTAQPGSNTSTPETNNGTNTSQPVNGTNTPTNGTNTSQPNGTKPENSTDSASSWGYAKQGSDWVKTCATGKAQSPVNIPTGSEGMLPDGAKVTGAPKLSYASVKPGLKLTNTGTTLKVDGKFGSASYNGVSYSATQLTIRAPSEHTLDGMHTDMELEIMHRSSKGKLLVVSVLFDKKGTLVSGQNLLTAIGTSTPPVGVNASNSIKSDVDLRSLGVASPHVRFYAYNGSLTTPPCSEPVTWFVLSTPQKLSEATAAVLHKLWAGNLKFAGGKGNNRATQPLNNRSITLVPRVATEPQWGYTKQGGDWAGTCSTGLHQSPISFTKDMGAVAAPGALLKPSAGVPTFRYAPRVGGLALQNTGRALMVSGGQLGNMTVSSNTYHFKEIKFHAPSEHAIDGLHTDMEMQIVHQKVGSKGSDGLAVVSILFDRTMGNLSGGDAFLASIGFGVVPKIANSSTPITSEVNLGVLEELKPGAQFWTYPGSLTTPPCTEGVQWFVATGVQKLSVPYAMIINSLYVGTSSFAAGNGNNRAVQPLNGRTVQLVPTVPASTPTGTNSGNSSNTTGTGSTTNTTGAGANTTGTGTNTTGTGGSSPGNTSGGPPTNSTGGISGSGANQTGGNSSSSGANANNTNGTSGELNPSDNISDEGDKKPEPPGISNNGASNTDDDSGDGKGGNKGDSPDGGDKSSTGSGSSSGNAGSDGSDGSGDSAGSDGSDGSGGSSWNYQKGGSDWTGTCKTGTAQSPVDIAAKRLLDPTANRVPQDKDLEPSNGPQIHLHAVSGLQIKNTGHVLQIAGGFGYTQFQGAKYTAVRMELHTPSEHTVDGVRLDGELQIVHKREGSDSLLVLSVLLDTKSLDTTGIQFFQPVGAEDLPAKAGSTSRVDQLDPTILNLGDGSARFYRYTGSLTSPAAGCQQGVNWLVATRVKHFPIALKMVLAKLFQHGNARATQPLNGRTVVVVPTYGAGADTIVANKTSGQADSQGAKGGDGSTADDNTDQLPKSTPVLVSLRIRGKTLGDVANAEMRAAFERDLVGDVSAALSLDESKHQITVEKLEAGSIIATLRITSPLARPLSALLGELLGDPTNVLYKGKVTSSVDPNFFKTADAPSAGTSNSNSNSNSKGTKQSHDSSGEPYLSPLPPPPSLPKPQPQAPNPPAYQYFPLTDGTSAEYVELRLNGMVPEGLEASFKERFGSEIDSIMGNSDSGVDVIHLRSDGGKLYVTVRIVSRSPGASRVASRLRREIAHPGSALRQQPIGMSVDASYFRVLHGDSSKPKPEAPKINNTVTCLAPRSFAPCGPACTATCADPQPVCAQICTPGCVCPREKPIWVEAENRCVEASECELINKATVKPTASGLPPAAGRPFTTNPQITLQDADRVKFTALFAHKLRVLKEMNFHDADRNLRLLVYYDGDVNKVMAILSGAMTGPEPKDEYIPPPLPKNDPPHPKPTKTVPKQTTKPAPKPKEHQPAKKAPVPAKHSKQHPVQPPKPKASAYDSAVNILDAAYD